MKCCRMPQNDATQRQQDQHADSGLMGGEAGAEHQELAQEQAERRQPDRRKSGQSHADGRDGHHLHHARTDASEFERVKGLMNVARREEQHRLGQRVVAHVQERAQDGQGRVHGDGDADETDMFEA